MIPTNRSFSRLQALMPFLLVVIFLTPGSRAALRFDEIKLANGELSLVFEDADGTCNQFSLEQSSTLNPANWTAIPSAKALPLDSTHGAFHVPMAGGEQQFYRVVGSYLDGAPTTMNQIVGGTLPPLSGLGALDVASFFMSGTEATWGEWRAVRAWAAARGYDIGNAGEGCADNHPVQSVSWFDAIKWCNARSEQAGLTPVYTVGGAVYRTGETVPEQDLSADGYRLPTEAEWEFGARGGIQTQNYLYSGGDDLTAVGRFFGNSSGAVCDLSDGRGTWAVGQKGANELAQYDMSGNVWEWCWDAVGDLRRIRGGSWMDEAASASVSMRSAASPGTRLNTIGFRAVRKISAFPSNQPPIVTLLPPIFEPTVPTRLFVIGDSTVANYGNSYYPWKGWGQVLQPFLDPARVSVQNRARGGRSSKSFIVEGLWNDVKAELVTGDYLLIQWGHNDRDWTKPERYTTTEEYKGYLRQYINEARALGVKPIFVTPMVMNAWSGSTMRNVFTESGNDYAGSMKAVAAELNVPLVDLNAKSHAFFKLLDYDTAGRLYYNTYVAGEYPNYPSGNNDGTHFQEMGALTMAKFVTDGLRELEGNPQVGSLAGAITPQYPVRIKANISSAGKVTVNTEFPVGVTFTLKALPGSGHNFLNWQDGAGQIFSTNNLTTFTMTAQGRTYTGYFDNPVPVSPPSSGSIIPGGTSSDYTMKLTASAFDSDGTIARVEYFGGASGAKIGEATASPYAFNWPVENGNYLVWAEAVDNAGLRSSSLNFQVDTTTANSRPTVSLTSPAPGSSFPSGSDVSLAANASDPDGSVAKVVFYLDGALLAEDNSAPYSATWKHVMEGPHTVEARSFDNRGLTSSAATVQVNIYNPAGGALLQEAEHGTLVGSFTVVDDAAASGGKSVEAVSGPAATHYVEFRFNVQTAGTYRLRTLEKSIDGLHDSMFVSVDGAAADQHLWYCARSSGYIEDYVSSASAGDPLELNFNVGLHTVRFGYRENMFLDLVELVPVP